MARNKFKKIERYFRTLGDRVKFQGKFKDDESWAICDGTIDGYYFRMWDESISLGVSGLRRCDAVICIKDVTHKNYKTYHNDANIYWPAFYSVGDVKKWIKGRLIK